MKKLFFILTILTISVGLLFAQNNVKKEKEAIKNVITKAYVNGLLNAGDLEPTKKGFHPDFCILYIQNNELKKYPIADWIEGYKSDKKKNPDGPKVKETIKFLQIFLK